MEIRAQELQFADADAEQLLNGTLELDLDATDVHRLQERTEGWPAGLQLAALSLRGRSDRAAYIRSLAGDDRQIGDYLHEVVEDAPRPLREFLLRTSILERMCAPLCGAVTDQPDSAALLAEAFRSNLFVVALDDRGYWFRYHHLLRDLLRRELARAEPELVPELHARAAAWHRAGGSVDEAIDHAIAAGGIEDATELIAAHWLEAWDLNPGTVARWLQSLPPGAIEADGRLGLVRGWAALFTGRLDEVEPAIASAELAPPSGPPVDVLGRFETKSSFLRAAHLYLRGDVARAHALAVEARDGAAPMSDGLASMLIGLTAYFGGDSEGALEPLENARTTMSGVGFVQALLTTLGRARSGQGRSGRDGGRRAVRGGGGADGGRVRPGRGADGIAADRVARDPARARGRPRRRRRRVRARRAARPPRRLAPRPRSRPPAARRAEAPPPRLRGRA